ncbi:hypothetical protein LguiA_006063 [Lonicera macranthoides]
MEHRLSLFLGLSPHLQEGSGMTRNRPMIASERQRKKKQYVRKRKGKATPIELASPHQAEEVVPEAPVHDVGEGSSVASKEDDGEPVDKSVLTTFEDHIAYAIWNGELLRSVLTKFLWECDPKYMEWVMKITHLYIQPSKQRTTARKMRGTQEVIQSKLQAAVDATLLLVEGALFDGQSQDMSVIVNKVYDIFKVTRTGDYENSMSERRSKRLHDLSLTVSTPGRAKAPPRKKSKK